MDRRSSRGKKSPDYIFLANHGVFVGGTDADEIRKKYSRLQKSLEERITRKPGVMPSAAEIPESGETLKSMAAGFFGEDTEMEFLSGGELDRYLQDRDAAEALTGSLTPDHIVYSGPGALYLEYGVSSEEWKAAAESFSKFWGKPPNIFLLGGDSNHRGALVAASGKKALDNAVLLMDNALEVIAYTESFGGPKLLEERFVRFIVDWEVENYRSKIASDA